MQYDIHCGKTPKEGKMFWNKEKANVNDIYNLLLDIYSLLKEELPQRKRNIHESKKDSQGKEKKHNDNKKKERKPRTPLRKVLMIEKLCRRGFSQKAAAEKENVSPSLVSLIMSGQHRLSKVNRKKPKRRS